MAYNIHEPGDIPQRKEGFPCPIDMKLQLNTVKNTRNSMARVMREYTRGQIEHVTFRNLVYMFSQLIAIHRLEKDIDIEKRLLELEQKINEQLQK